MCRYGGGGGSNAGTAHRTLPRRIDTGRRLTAGARRQVTELQRPAACRALAAERDAIPDDMQARGIQHCVDDERTAREQLEREWSQFKPADRAICIGGSKAGSVTPVYTELITCLEVASDAELLRARTAAIGRSRSMRY
jgi:hypothetical protein